VIDGAAIARAIGVAGFDVGFDFEATSCSLVVIRAAATERVIRVAGLDVGFDFQAANCSLVVIRVMDGTSARLNASFDFHFCLSLHYYGREGISESLTRTKNFLERPCRSKFPSQP
jgi:deoxyinosine 3'endonuclease (endonuclease V)